MIQSVEWKSKSGHKIKVCIYEQLSQAMVNISVNGSHARGSDIIKLNEPKTINGITIIGQIGPVGLEAARFNQIKSAISLMDEMISKKPKVILDRLIEERNDLSLNANFWINESISQEENFILDASKNGFHGGPASNKSEIEKAKAELSSFDIAHPEVLKEIEARSNEAHERFMASN